MNKNAKTILLASALSAAYAKIQGDVAPGFEELMEEFQDLFKGEDRRSQLCVYVGDTKVIDAWGDDDFAPGFGPDKITNVFSSGKSVAAILMGVMADQGLFDWNDPVTKYWPAFGQNGKDWMKINDVMRHEAGLAILSQLLDFDWVKAENIRANKVGELLEKDTTVWFGEEKTKDPAGAGPERNYHALTRDLVSNEIFRRVEPQGRTMGEYMRDEWPDINAYIGVRDPSVMDRVQQMVPTPDTRTQAEIDEGKKLEEEQGAAWYAVYGDRVANYSGFIDDGAVAGETQQEASIRMMNSVGWREAEIPSANVHASARGLCELGAFMANRGTFKGKTLMSEKSWEAFHADPVTTIDVSYGMSSTFTNGGAASFDMGEIPEAEHPWQQEQTAVRQGYYGWLGFGGSVFQWHPDLKISFAYVPSELALLDHFNARGGGLQATARRLAEKHWGMHGGDGDWEDSDDDGDDGQSLAIDGLGTVGMRELEDGTAELYLRMGASALAASSAIAAVAMTLY